MPSKTKEVNEKNNSKKIGKKSVTAKKKSATTKKSKTTKKTTVTKKSASKKTKKTATKKVVKPSIEVVEYYDLPYRYNETIVKILYQTPDTLFVYWDISDNDRENYIKQYGNDFFNTTRPVLLIHNNSNNYCFEIPINDFANSWYFHVNDSKCDYRVELGRRPNNNIQDYIYIQSSNEIEIPNDHILFNTSENNTIKFRNIKNNTENSIPLYDFIKNLPAIGKKGNIPYISEDLIKNIYTKIYTDDELLLSNNKMCPSSGSSSSRFI